MDKVEKNNHENKIYLSLLNFATVCQEIFKYTSLSYKKHACR